MLCQTCNNPYYVAKILDMRCPVCGGSGLGTNEYYDLGYDGYAISLAEFKGLLKDNEDYTAIRHSVCGWLDCTIFWDEKDEPLLRHVSGLYIPCLAAHLKIQMNKTWQFDLYQMAMAIWR